VTSALNAFRNGAVGFIDLLDGVRNHEAFIKAVPVLVAKTGISRQFGWVPVQNRIAARPLGTPGMEITTPRCKGPSLGIIEAGTKALCKAATAGCHGNHVCVDSIWGGWLHRLVR